MSLVELLPDIHSLPRADMLRLIQFIVQELAKSEASPLLEAGREYAVWSPDRAFTAAETLLETLRSE